MKYVRFRDPAGSVRRGEYRDGTISFGTSEYDPDEVDVLAPTDPSKVVCIGRNYAEHADERDEEVPDRPLLFLKPPNALAGHGDEITLPAGKDKIEHEAELGVVIGQQCRNVDAADAMEVIEGYTCMNDISNRDDQRVEQNWVRGKAFDGAAPMGPVVATPEEVPEDASVQLRVNGETRQDSSREHMIFSIPELIEEITAYMTLEAGDVIATGTPAGVGPLADGDTVEVEIDGVGTLEHDVRAP
ncbi:2-keto-4-pentenoate hydratase/2-oxohepta-3-ene-1,7-dioic acid hydratase (catechol pathway) [Natronoarchaeum philippinense]|uniref:2-keto-4-pentenoate hydratase/2-oxohepta-3-ene-1,7-dioic acid hydratase (Catechol pathway) n=1 Tax=Natronoarchaeum philippinense TaxID=558529 RepID=A0A285NA71_NATPI|nr:fumarylacetoacetate hydrolase family protein [Natronoarchaeum philippinense]SNZ06218.1 2-keto-4-pentenoate hydratase/2-oxohepta-3-ene-1,7-dioic acid hydratase (catechol pathway) [Natronoarchaeum philippinense]